MSFESKLGPRMFPHLKEFTDPKQPYRSELDQLRGMRDGPSKQWEIHLYFCEKGCRTGRRCEDGAKLLAAAKESEAAIRARRSGQ